MRGRLVPENNFFGVEDHINRGKGGSYESCQKSPVTSVKSANFLEIIEIEYLDMKMQVIALKLWNVDLHFHFPFSQYT